MADVLSTSPSPTFSAPRSPSQAAFHARPYHVSRRVSSEHRSPRLQHPVSDLRPSTSTTRPPKAAAASPQARVQTTDAATQYTPPDLPPTAQQSARPAHSGVTAPLAREPAKRRASSSAEDAVTDPPEPDPRLDPQPAYQHDANGTGNGPAVAQPAPPQPSSHAESSSAAKRARPPSPADRVMPIKYETCDVKELGVLISDMLMELVRLNDGIPLKDGQLTRFHSRYVWGRCFSVAGLLTVLRRKSAAWHLRPRLPQPPHRACHALPSHPPLDGILYRPAVCSVPDLYDQ